MDLLVQREQPRRSQHAQDDIVMGDRFLAHHVDRFTVLTHHPVQGTRTRLERFVLGHVRQDLVAGGEHLVAVEIPR